MGSLQLQDFVAGWVGGAASVVVGHPLDTIKTRLQAGQGYGNTLNCVLTVYRNESVAGFFKGMSFPLASISVYSSVVFGVFSNTQRLLSQLRHGDPSRTPALADVALASMVAGFISVGIGTPVDLVKIRLQMQTQPYIKGCQRGANPTRAHAEPKGGAASELNSLDFSSFTNTSLMITVVVPNCEIFTFLYWLDKVILCPFLKASVQLSNLMPFPKAARSSTSEGTL
ncbi:solute carrier family 25 member 48 isoform X6 [Phalacrocorax carbo]|uniref:solute carrier family 25 member 48 isoform X6 n=1 Tax=Phalacrocorax carbo TaxID=9209 RepID=UPI00311A502D